VSFQVLSSPPLELGGGTLKNVGDQTVYYRDELPVSSSVNDGSLAAGSSVTVTGSVWVVAGTGLRSALTFAPSVTETGGSGTGLPSGGSVGDVVVNTGSGTGAWTTPTDPTAADIAFTPTGTIASTDIQAAIAEVASEAAAGGSGNPSGTEIPSDRSWKAWTFPPVPSLPNYTVDAGYVIFAKIPIRTDFTAANLFYYKKDHAVTLSAGYMGIYSSTGTLLGKTADIHTSLVTGGDAKDDLSGDPATSGVNSHALVAESGQSLALTSGSFVIAAVLCVGSTGYQTVRIDGYGLTNGGLTGLSVNAWRTTNGKTTLPATISTASREAYMIGPIFLALS
jgi:hypothetical protein